MAALVGFSDDLFFLKANTKLAYCTLMGLIGTGGICEETAGCACASTYSMLEYNESAELGTAAWARALVQQQKENTDRKARQARLREKGLHPLLLELGEDEA
jgi:hypothetical protein